MKLAHLVIALMMVSYQHAICAEQSLPLTKVAEIRRLSRDVAVQAIPVKISGVCVASFLGDFRAFVINDGEESIWVRMASTNFDSSIHRGAHLVLEGVTDPASYSPSIRGNQVTCVGELPLPAPRHPALENLLTGSEDCQWIEVEGVVQAVYPPGAEGLGVLLILEGLPCRLRISHEKAKEFGKYVDARIRVRGIFTPDVNARSEAAFLKIHVADPKADIEIVEPPPKDPFLAPKVPLNRLMPFAPDARPWHRRVVSGIVTFAVTNKFFFLQEGNDGLRVDSPSKVKIGQWVEASGFVDTSHTFASLRNAVVRVIGASDIPAAVPVTAAQLLDPANRSDWGKPQSTDYGGRWVKLSGVVRRIDHNSGKEPFAILIESARNLFFARIPNDVGLSDSRIADWKLGATVEVSGVCEYDFPEKGDPVPNYTPRSFNLWLTGPENVKVLKAAPWWTATRLFVVLGGVLLAFGLVAVWTLLLQRQVSRQVEIIANKTKLAATEGERVRIARDLHDDIGTELSSMAMLADLVKRDACTKCAENPRLAEIASHAQRTVRQLEEIVWAINPANDSVERFAGYFCKRIQAYLTLAGVSARFDLPEIFPDYPLPGRLRHNLFLAAKEAVYNAVRHGSPTLVTCRMAMTGDTLTVTVEDNGCGFEEKADPQVNHGSSNMRKRMEDIGGTFVGQSEVGKGTTVQFSISLKTGRHE